MPYVTDYVKGISVYIPRSKDQFNLEFTEECAVLDGIKVSVRRPIINNFLRSVKALWTRRQVDAVYISYEKVKIKTTDNMIKFADSLICGAKFEKAEQITAMVTRIKKIVNLDVVKPKGLYHKEIVKLFKMGYDEST